MREESGYAAETLRALKVNLSDLGETIQRSLSTNGGLMTIGGDKRGGLLSFTARTKAILFNAAKLANSNILLGMDRIQAVADKDQRQNQNNNSQCFEKMVGTDLASEEQYQLYVQFLYAHKVYDIIIIFANESLDVYPHDIFYSTYLAASYFYTNRYNKARQVLPDVSPDLLGEICPEIMVHPLLGPLVPQSPWVEKKEER